jgi:glucokinase
VAARQRLVLAALPEGADLTPAQVLAAAKAGDPLALEALAEMGRSLGVVVSACVALLNPARVIIGGGLGVAAFEFLVNPVREAVERRTPGANSRDLLFLPSQLESPALGAACLVWYGFRQEAGG